MRLTRKVKNDYYLLCEIDASDGEPNLKEHANKLGQLEDIEEELGIDLITLFKAMKQGHIWVKKKGKIISSCDYNLDLTGTTYGFYCKDIGEELLVKDYGKTWALTKEELEYE